MMLKNQLPSAKYLVTKKPDNDQFQLRHKEYCNLYSKILTYFISVPNTPEAIT